MSWRYTGTRIVIADQSNGDNANYMGLPAYRPRRNFFMKAHDRDRRFRFGQASRRIVTCDYSGTRIGGEIIALYSGLLGPNDVNSRAWTVQPWD